MRLRLMTWNIHSAIPMGHLHGGYVSGERELEQIADLIRAMKPDVAALQEVDCEFGSMLEPDRRRSSGLNQPRRLSQLTGLAYTFGSAQDDIAYPSDNALYLEWGTAKKWTNNGLRHGEVGNAVLSSMALVSEPRNHALPMLPGKERRACLQVELPRCVILATHLQHDSDAARREQMRSVLEIVGSQSGHRPVFIFGDMNDPDPEAAGSVVEIATTAGMHDLAGDFARAARTDAGRSFPADIPTERLDIVLCSHPVEVLNVEVPATKASDHRPVVVTVEIKP